MSYSVVVFGGLIAAYGCLCFYEKEKPLKCLKLF